MVVCMGVFAVPTKKDAIEAYKEVQDPEIGIDVYTMGLIYDTKVKGDEIKVVMTLTTPMCPFGPQMIEEVKEKLKQKGFKKIEVELSFDPPWKPSEELREMLGV